MYKQSSLRSCVLTKAEAEGTMEKREEELDLLFDPIALANSGIVLLMDTKKEGKVVFSLRELPLHSEWRTTAGNTISRISRSDVLVCDDRGHPLTINVPHHQLHTILYLPDHVLQMIWLLLAPKDFTTYITPEIRSCRLVCRHWARMIGRMVSYSRTKGIRLVPPRLMAEQRLRQIRYDQDNEDGSNDDSAEGPAPQEESVSMCPIGILVRLASHPPSAPPKGILKLQGQPKTNQDATKKRVRFVGIDEEPSEEEKERLAQESVRRKLTEGSELSKRFLLSFFGWNKHGSVSGAKTCEPDQHDSRGVKENRAKQPSGGAGECRKKAINVDDGDGNGWFSENTFENQARNMARLKELEMRLEEIVRSKSRVHARPMMPKYSEPDAQEKVAAGAPAQGIKWSESAAYLQPEATAECRPCGGPQKQSLARFLCGTTGPRKALFAR